MPLRHYTGSVPSGGGAWRCPTCHAENVTPLADGCPSCGVGKDAQHVGRPAPPRAPDPALAAAVNRLAAIPVAHLDWDLVDVAFDGWLLGEHGLSTDGQVLARRAYRAGVEWARKQARTPADPRDPEVIEAHVAPAQTGAQLYMSHPDGSDGVTLVEDRAFQTILAALAFYRDNQLGYGPVPGQLTALEVSELIETLTPVEVTNDGPHF